MGRFDTLLIAELCEWGFERGRGREALDRINWAHGHFTIANDDYLYVLATFIYEPIRWIDRYGWRPTCRNEKLGYYHFWRGVGTRMGIADVPATYEAFEQWSREYEHRTFRYSESNHSVGAATRDLFASWYPRPLPGTRTLVDALLRLRGRFVRLLPPRSEPNFFSNRPSRTYPHGYDIDALGPPGLIAADRRHPGRK